MAIARENQFYVESFAGSITVGNTLTIPCAPTFPDSCDRAHFIVVGSSDPTAVDSSITSVTVGGQAATRVSTQTTSSGAILELWVYMQPPRATHNVVVQFGAVNANAYAVVNSFEQVDPLDGAGVLDATSGTTGAFDERTLTSGDLATSLALQAGLLFGGATNVSLTAVAPFSNSGTAQVGASPNRTRVAASVVGTAPGGASVAARYNFSTNPKPWAHIALEVKAARLLPLAAQMGVGF